MSTVPVAPVGSTRMPLVAAVSVTHNRREDILSLLSQLQAIDYPTDSLSVYLVDNASTDGTAARVRQDFPHVKLVESSSNTGIAPGFNRGLQEALADRPRADYVWLLDSDVGLESGSLRPLVEAMRRYPSLGIVGSAIYDPQQPQRLVTAGLALDWRSGEGSFVIPAAGERPELLDVDLIPACSLLARSELCVRLGLWDELLRLYWGDTDWCLRFQRAGYRVSCCPASRAWHRDWSSVRRGFFAPAYLHDHLRGALLCHLRHDPRKSRVATRRLILKTYLRAGLEQLTMRRGFSRAYHFAVQDFLAGSFDSRETASLMEAPLLPHWEAVQEELAHHVPQARRWMISGFADTEQQSAIQAGCERSWGPIVWRRQAQAREPSQPILWSEFRIVRPRELLTLARYLLSWPWRADVHICDISSHHLSNLTAARYTVFLDGRQQGVIYRNAFLPGIGQCIGHWIRGGWAAYVALPRALRRSASLVDAIEQGVKAEGSE